jgi:hypothetical protein
MIDKSLPPVQRDTGWGQGEVLEALAYTYLTSYVPSALNTTQLQPYYRAWGPNLIKLVLGNGTDRPDYVMAFYTGGQNVKVIVAVRGVSNVIGLFRAAVNFTGVQVGTRPGLVYSSWKSGADAVKASILADTDYVGLTYNKPVSITFTGFSRGAAIAEVLGEEFQTAFPAMSISVIKFASPAVGNASWVNYGGRVFPMLSIFNDADPINGLPSSAVIDGNLFGSGYAGGRNMFYAFDRNPARYNWNTLVQDGTVVGQVNPLIQTMIQFPNGPWVFHSVAMYRKLFGRMLVPQYTLNKYRFNYLSFPDENNFGYDCYANPLVTSFTPAIDPAFVPDVQVPPALLPESAGFGTDQDNSYGGGSDEFDDNPGAGPTLIVPPAVPADVPSWSNQPMAIRNRTRAR